MQYSPLLADLIKNLQSLQGVGAKSAQRIAFNLLSKNSTWLQLDVNGSTFVYEVGSGNVIDLEIAIKHYDQFEGV